MRNFKDATWKENVTKVIQEIREQEIKFIRLQFTDINGMLKNLAVSSKNIESIFENGQSFDGSSITGYRPIEESDGAVPRPDNLRGSALATQRKIFCEAALRHLHSAKQAF